MAINYDYAVTAAKQAGGDDQIVVPPSTVAIQTPTVVVDKNAQADCVELIMRELFLRTEHPQRRIDASIPAGKPAPARI